MPVSDKIFGLCYRQGWDTEKTKAITEMKPPASVSELRRFMGMINQMGKFSPNLAEHSQPLRELLGKNRAWIWGPAQDQALMSTKDELSSSVTLSLYHPEAETNICRCLLSWTRGSTTTEDRGNLEANSFRLPLTVRH